MSEAPPTADDDGAGSPAPEQVIAPSAAMSVQRLLPRIHGRHTPRQGRRSSTEVAGYSGHSVRALKPSGERPLQDIALLATLRAAALRKAARDDGPAMAPARLVGREDLRVHLRRARTGSLILFVVDASGSMAARQRMAAVKGAMLGLLLDAYQKRDRVGLIAFRGDDAELLVPPTNSVELAERRLRRLPTGGRTPLAAALLMARRVLICQQHQDRGLAALLVIMTDGRSNQGPAPQAAAAALASQAIPTLVLDSEQGFVKMGRARPLARWLNAVHIPLDRLVAGEIAQIVGGVRRALDTT